MEFGRNLLKSAWARAHASAAKTTNIQLQVSYVPFSSSRNVLYSARAIYPQIQIEFILFLRIFPEASSRPHKGFIILLSSYSIFYKLSFQSIYLVQRLIFLTVLYSYIGPKLTGLLLTSQVSSISSAILVVQGRCSIQTRCGLSYISSLKAQSLHIVLAQ